MVPVILAFVIMRLVIALWPGIKTLCRWLRTRVSVSLASKRPRDIFDANYIDSKIFYMKLFGKEPCVHFIGGLDVSKAYPYVDGGEAGRVLGVYQSNYYNWSQKRLEFNRSILKLENRVLVEFGYEYARILFDKNSYTYVEKLVTALVAFEVTGKGRQFEINVISLSAAGLELKQLAIKPVELDISLYYNDDFAAVDKLVRERLENKNDKGIVLLHGLPGTGKTTYLRYLVGVLKKRVLFVSPAVAGNLMNPEFIDLLLDHPNSVLIIEDAENILMDRKLNNNNSVSNLLNISDGLLSDCLNVQIICTFNNALHLVDSALLRKGRLIAKYEFGKLNVGKAQRLSDHLGHDQQITRPMTIAEITHPGEPEATIPSAQVAGFRREALEAII